MIGISHLSRAEVLRRLYNASKPQGMGHLQHRPGDMSLDEAEKLLRETAYFDYLHGRVMKVCIPKDGKSLEEWGYDRDNGKGAASRAISNR
jgi:hypothetical protein